MKQTVLFMPSLSSGTIIQRISEYSQRGERESKHLSVHAFSFFSMPEYVCVHAFVNWSRLPTHRYSKLYSNSISHKPMLYTHVTHTLTSSSSLHVRYAFEICANCLETTAIEPKEMKTKIEIINSYSSSIERIDDTQCLNDFTNINMYALHYTYKFYVS